jgi:hypothetical protein
VFLISIVKNGSVDGRCVRSLSLSSLSSSLHESTRIERTSSVRCEAAAAAKYIESVIKRVGFKKERKREIVFTVETLLCHSQAFQKEEY